MALCDYHEDTEAVATCVVCKSSICGKCQEFGADGMCGMCLEMSNARKASMEASRQARVEAASAAPAGASAPPRPAAPQPPTRPQAPPPKPGAAPPRPPAKGTTGSLAKPAAAAKGPPAPPAKPGGSGKMVQPGSKPASKGGFCGEHDGQQQTAACTNCRKKVCPYCLDLYDLCVECRNLPHCSRHESMVSAAKCQSCNLDYCRLCLDNTPFCDRCRTLGMAAVKNAQKPGTGKLDPAKAARPGTGKLETPVAAPGDPPSAGSTPAKKNPITPPKPGQPGYRPPGKGPSQGVKKADRQPAMAYIFGGLVLLGAATYLLFGDGRPRLTPEEANAGLRSEMALVQAAARAIHQRTNRPPDSVNQVLEQLKAQGVNLKTVNPPIKLLLNAPGSEPLTILLATSPDGFEVRALDAEGRPLSENGRDVILGDFTKRKGAPDAPSEQEASGEPRSEASPTAAASSVGEGPKSSKDGDDGTRTPD